MKFISLLTLVICLCSCSELITKHPHKDIVISDTDMDYRSVRIKDIEGEYVIVVLIEGTPNLAGMGVQDITNSPYSIGKVEKGIINVRLSELVDYWDGSGSYWVAFFIPNGSATKISWGYCSKEAISLFQPVTYMSNKDFMPRIALNIDISGLLDF